MPTSETRCEFCGSAKHTIVTCPLPGSAAYLHELAVRQHRAIPAAPRAPEGPTTPEWGDALRYLTDDRDYRTEDQRELVLMQGGNGDYYVQVVEPGMKAVRGVRICMSGGASSENPALARAIADAYRALYDAAHGRPSPLPPFRAALAPLSGREAARVERVAEAIYNAMRENDPEGKHRPWVERGNSLMQDEARSRARAALADTDTGRTT